MKKKELLKELIVTFQNLLPAKVISRNLELPLNSEKIITAPGVRRCGKSSLFLLTMNHLLTTGVAARQILFLNFDDERLQFTVEDWDEILQAYRELYPDINMHDVYIFFDEIQMTTGWQQFVRRIYDQETKHIFLTGSNSRMLSSEIATSLRGRTIQFEVFPLSFDEYCRFKGTATDIYHTATQAKIIHLFQEYLHHGAFPEIVRSDPAYREQILQEYFFVMLYKDLVERYNIRNPAPVKYFIRRILANLTKPTSINKIYNELKSQGVTVGKNTLYELAEQTASIYLFFTLPKYEKSLIKESSADKKYYCIDNGFRNALSVSHSEDNGALLENLVFLHLRRKAFFQHRLYYYKNKKECDFVVTDQSKVTELIQVSWDISDEQTKKREIAGLMEASETTGCRQLTIVTADTEKEITEGDKTVFVVPAWKWLLQKA
jgi:predicted AAA+ superfamily ATPase